MAEQSAFAGPKLMVTIVTVGLYSIKRYIRTYSTYNKNCTKYSFEMLHDAPICFDRGIFTFKIAFPTIDDRVIQPRNDNRRRRTEAQRAPDRGWQSGADPRSDNAGPRSISDQRMAKRRGSRIEDGIAPRSRSGDGRATQVPVQRMAKRCISRVDY